jgi:hypothetical protein
LTLNDTSAVVTGNTPTNTESGVATFTGLKILTMNYFTLTVSATDMVSAVSNGFFVTNYAKYIELTANETSPSLNFTILLTVALKGDDNLVFTGDCVVTLTESTSSLQGTLLQKTISGGSGTFEVYLKSTGLKNIVATCPNTGTATSITKTCPVTVLANTLKITVTPSGVI